MKSCRVSRLTRLFGSGIVCVLLMLPAMAQESSRLSGLELVQALRQGGYIILIRHPTTEHTQADTDPWHLDNIQAQRQLSDKGRGQSQSIGQALKALGLPVGHVVTSKFYRAIEAAKLAAFSDIQSSLDVSEGGLVVPPLENQRRTEALRKLLATPPAAGTNTVIISHRPNIMDAAGKDFFDLAEGEASIFKPKAPEGFALVARVKAEGWSEMAQQLAKP